MKKYIAAGAVAIMVFAFAASAASLSVNGGVLQAGADNDLTCTDDADVTYTTSNDTNGHWIGAIHLEFDTACEDGYAIVNGFGPAANNQILSLVSTPIGADGKVTLDIFDGATRVADLVNLQVLVKDQLVPGQFECAGMEYSGNPMQQRVACPTP
jgi:hypothetical protein